ncbi:MAG: G8 domain-containing protein, partial [Planctomycetota bacterium]
MILRSGLSRKSRRKKTRNKPLDFQLLEKKQLMAADLLGHGPHPMPAETQLVNTTQSPTGNTSHMHQEGNCQHHANPAVMALVAHEDATHVATGTGNWSDPSIWQNGQVPTQGARIVVSEGQTVTVDGVYNAEFKTLRIDGTLKFATDVNTQLKVDTLVSTGCARLEMGTQANPVDANVTAKIIFADDGAIDRNWDPTRVSRGAILMGSTEIAGAQTTDRVTLATQPLAGATSLQLSEVPVNWKVGDEIVITGTNGATSDEVRVIASVNGTTVQLDRALDVDHVAPKSHLNVHVANKTRNVQFSSENTAVKRRGHIMFAHTLDVKIDNAGFYDLGRTDKSRDLDDVFFEFDEGISGNNSGAPIHYTLEIEQESTNIRGRYALHFHRGGVDPSSTAATVSGSVVDGSPGWGFVNHSSHVNFNSNVAYGVWGSAYYTEAGDEIGSFDNNIAIRSVNPRNPVDPETREIATD